MPLLINRRRFLIVVGVAALCSITLIAPIRRAPVWSFVGQFDAFDPTLVALGAVVSLAAIWNRGLMNRAAHGALGLRTTAAEMTRTASVAFGAQKLVKSAGASGLAVFVHQGKRRGRCAGQVTGACVVVAASSFVALGITLAGATIVLAASGRLTGWWALAGAGFGLYAVAVAGVITLVLRHRSLLDRLWTRGHRVVARLRRRPRSAPSPHVVDDVLAALAVARSNARELRRTLLHAVAGKALGGFMLLIAAHGAGVGLSPADALAVYATVLAASFVSILPGGVGTVEASALAVLIGGGAGATAAALTVSLFRVFDVWLPLAIGLLAARGQWKAPVDVRSGDVAVREPGTVAVGPAIQAAA